MFLPANLESKSRPDGTPTAAQPATEARERARVRDAMAAHAAGVRRARTLGLDAYGARVTRPLLVFPEGSITNGRVGVMRFAQSAFGLGAPVTPLAIQLRTPLPLEADTIWSPLGGGCHPALSSLSSARPPPLSATGPPREALVCAFRAANGRNCDPLSLAPSLQDA